MLPGDLTKTGTGWPDKCSNIGNSSPRNTSTSVTQDDNSRRQQGDPRYKPCTGGGDMSPSVLPHSSHCLSSCARCAPSWHIPAAAAQLLPTLLLPRERGLGTPEGSGQRKTPSQVIPKVRCGCSAGTTAEAAHTRCPERGWRYLSCVRFYLPVVRLQLPKSLRFPLLPAD